MGRMLGAHDADDLDRPDLNKCPECGSYFAPTAEYCPICQAFCPEEFRAGNRKPVKVKKQTFSRASSRVTFVEWYHSWWFIILAMFFMPLVGIVLLITSPHSKKQKLIFVAAALLYTVLVSWGVGGMLIGMIRGQLEFPVDADLPREEYIAACEIVDAEDYYRMAEAYRGRKVAVTLTVREMISDAEEVYSHARYPNYYVCSDEQQTFTVLVCDCIREERMNLLPGDTVIFYGEGAGNVSVTDMQYVTHTAPCIHAAFLIFLEEDQ